VLFLEFHSDLFAPSRLMGDGEDEGERHAFLTPINWGIYKDVIFRTEIIGG